MEVARESEGSLFIDSGGEGSSDEDVIEVHLEPRRPNARHNEALGSPYANIPPEHLPGLDEALREASLNGTRFPALREPSRHLGHHHHHVRRHRHRHHHHHHHHRPREQQQQQMNRTRENSTVIDLTEEPDSPVEAQPSRDTSTSQPRSQGNPRRTVSQRISPPTLARSDGTINRSNMPDVIDLTADDDMTHQQQTRVLPPPIHLPRPRFGPRFPRMPQNGFHNNNTDTLFQVDLYPGRPLDTTARGLGLSRRLAGIFNATSSMFGYNTGNHFPPAAAEAARESPKPPIEPIPPTREGFTRDTCAEPTEEMVVVCPCCNEELAFDPNATSVPSKAGKRKRAPGEHHFWALKKCGHVYCADCFESRRPTKTNRHGAGFPGPEGKEPLTVVNDLHCAVSGCNTKIALKTEWVGLYV